MKNIAVFLGSSQQVSPLFLDEAESIGRQLAQAEYNVVFGGFDSGCMSRLASGVADKNGRLIGVSLEGNNLAEQKRKIIEQADAFIAFPGGLGTLDEVSEVLAQRQIRAHSKPIIFYNYLDYWSPFLDCLESFYQQRMISTPVHDLIQVFDEGSRVLEYLNRCFRN